MPAPVRDLCPFNGMRLCPKIRCVFWAESGSCKILDLLDRLAAAYPKNPKRK
ncbi:unnamed protein product [marine sediment metagenome]|uniref:Uncharacterized protein n=1 Tax=marine sediment metagenome TaxID=412755 RepID=X1MHA1_9ZZZZ